jgi:hypothetical protein
MEGKKLLIFYVGSIHGSQNLKQLHHVRGKRLQDSRFSLMTERFWTTQDLIDLGFRQGKVCTVCQS